jgi:uncharacterized protein (TIGR03435 family)
MPEPDDISLLRQYTVEESEAAFATLVERHINKVYSVALRHSRNPHQAEEITQAVFVILARKARGLGKNVILSGWLYQTARLTSVTFLRSEIRRARREQEAHMQNISDESQEDETWKQIGPQLDVAMAGLNDTDRNAVVLRFFDGKSMSEVGTALGASEEAAKKRVNRALGKLRKFFTKRGVVSTTAIIGAVISNNSVQAAPMGLAKTVSAVAVAKGAVVSTSTLTLIKGALKIMAWTKTQTAIVAGAVILLAAGTTTVAINKIVRQRDENLWRVPNLKFAILNEARPQVTILPTKFQDGERYRIFDSAKGRSVAIGFPINAIVAFAYDWPFARVVFASADPGEKYDYIANLPQGSMTALQRELKNKLGLTARTETRVMDALVLKVQRPNAPGLKPPAGGIARDGDGSIHFQSVPISTPSPSVLTLSLATELEAYFGIPVIDQTGLTQNFNIDLTWNELGDQDPDHDALKRAVLDQLGLELVPTNMPIEMLVVEKAN